MIEIAKRTEGKHKADFGTEYLYKKYKEVIIDKTSVYNVTRRQHTDVLKQINAGIMKLIIEKSFEFTAPFRLGYYRVKTRQMKYKFHENGDLNTRQIPVDYKATKEMWARNPEAKAKKKLVFITNEHYDEQKPFFYWNKQRINFTNGRFKSFVPSRANKRALAYQIKTFKTKYYA